MKLRLLERLGGGGMRGGAKEVKNKKKFQNRFAERDRGSRSTQFRLLCYISLDGQIYKAFSIPYMHSKITVTDITVRNKLHFLSEMFYKMNLIFHISVGRSTKRAHRSTAGTWIRPYFRYLTWNCVLFPVIMKYIQNQDRNKKSL